mmetsp:Transcript_34220/g.106243  ORF Transcript_34220/g.106243 Transcript_34220/m.106243 type:complete len:271 (-) Transcript_34220:246-1058(-)
MAAGTCHDVNAEFEGSPQIPHAPWPQQLLVFEVVDQADGSSVDGPEEESSKSVSEWELSQMLSQVLSDNRQLEDLEVYTVLEQALVGNLEAVSTPASTAPTSPTARSEPWQPSFRPDSPVPVSSEASPADSESIVTQDLDRDELEMTGATVRTASTFGDNVFEGGSAMLALQGRVLLDVEELVSLSQAAERPCLSLSQVQTLPRVQFGAPEAQCCSICMENFRQGMLLIGMPCRHIFHIDCLTEWLQRSSQCPNCRAPIEPAEEDDGTEI